MTVVWPPLGSDDRGSAVGNLQQALLLLLDKRLIEPPAEGDSLERALRLEQQTPAYGQATTQAVTLFQERHRLRPSGTVDDSTADAINRYLRQLDALEPEPDVVLFIVSGRVVSRERAGVGGLRVVIVDKTIGTDRDVPVAETTTDPDGGYRASFTISGRTARSKARPDLQAQAFAGATRLGVSPVKYNASARERLDILVAPAAASLLPSEQETLSADIARHFSGRPRDLQESGDRQDITYLAHKTGWDARAVALAALADQFSARTADAAGTPRLDSPFFYALFRAGYPADERALYQVTPGAAVEVWKEAIARGVISSALEASLPLAGERLQDLVVQHALDGPAVAGLSPLKDLLDVSLGNDAARQRRFAELYARHRTAPSALWDAVRTELGAAAETRLRIDGQLAYLTRNNAPLMRRLHAAAGRSGMTGSAALATQGYYRADRWRALVDGEAVPLEIPGASEDERRSRYAELLAAQVRLSFPTLVVAQMIKEGETPVPSARRDDVSAFLALHHGKFELGLQSIHRYVARNALQVSAEVTREIARIQRVYQITPSDAAMNALLGRGIDSARAVARYDREEFVRTHHDVLGGASNARLTHAKAQQVHNIVLHLAMSYLVARTTPQLGVHSPAKYSHSTPAPIVKAMEAVEKNQATDPYTWLVDIWGPTSPDNAADVIPYATLEALFGEMDFCACDHCRSVLSPAAYLVDLLQFLDRDTVPDDENPLTILLERRPDIEHLPLTCDNTNTPLPYIDLVNETLEYFVTHQLSLTAYTGHTTDGTVTPAELLATPQFVEDAAYRTLAGQPLANEGPPLLPPAAPLPFHQPLEGLRRYFDRFETPLPDVMELLRTHDGLERPAPADPLNPIEYGWRDILMEELRLSRAEHRLLTDRQITLQQLYGFDPGELEAHLLFGRPAAPPDKPALAGLSNAKAFSRLMGISYEEIVEILKTRFVNPHSTLVPKLERLGVPFPVLKAFKDGVLPDAEFDTLVAGVDPAEFGNDIKGWVKNDENYNRIMGLMTLTDPTGENNACSFDTVEFRYANPVATNTLRPFEFYRLSRFIRLWRKLGWTIEQTDKAIAALYPAGETPNSTDDVVNLQRLDQGFLIMLPRLGVVRRVMRTLKLKPKKDLLSLLAAFAPIDTHGAASLYRQMFLFPAPATGESAFADDGFGNFLTKDAGLLDHAEALRAAFLLTDDELKQIVAALAYDENTLLEIDTISAIYRRGWLARKLKLSVLELLLIMEATGIDPFASPDPPHPGIARVIDFVGRLRGVALKAELALYAVWNRDLSGRSSPGERDILELARSLRAAFGAIEAEFAVTDDPTGQIARARMTLVYGNDATNVFFGFLDNTLVTEVAYDHAQETLEPAILQAAPGRIAYDDFAKRLSYAGVMSEAARNALQGASTSAAFKEAIHSLDPQKRSLFAENQKVVAPFFDRYPELQPLYELYAFFGQPTSAAAVAIFVQDFAQRYPDFILDKDAWVAAGDAEPERRTLLLESLLPELKERRKRQQALTTAAAAAKSDVRIASAILDDRFVLNPAGLTSAADVSTLPPALDDLPAIEITGLSSRINLGATVDPNAQPFHTSDAEPSIAYAASGEGALPMNPASGIWSGYLEAPENGFYNFRIEPGAMGGSGATSATLSLDGEDKPLAKDGELWSNATAIELRAGTLYAMTLKVDNLTAGLNVRWQAIGRGWEVIPQRYLYSTTVTNRLRTTYVRFLKASSLAAALKLTPGEVAHLASREEYRIAGRGWLNSLPVAGAAEGATSVLLLEALDALLEFAALKARFAPNDERLLTVLQDPAGATDTADGDTSPLLALTRWDGGSLDALLIRFGQHLQAQPTLADRASLKNLATFVRVHRAYLPVKKIGVSAASLMPVTTNEPQAPAVRAFKDALRARYEEADWLGVLRPINDEMRGLQRDALVAYTLHHMRAHTGSEHIDTPEKLFEYFLMDVQMASCMQTSRVRHALSSVQLFTERCFMNLEPRVAPSVFEAKHRKQWAWMKRYRVWEANRKVFLWPENLADPEFLLNASPLLKEALSELLQSDITDDRAATALLNYLSKLEEIAKLEPCGMYFVEGEAGVTDDIVHVVARTLGANRKYFYRRYDGLWSAWEQIKLDIEDNPVTPVVWKDRLFVFWLKILKDVTAAPPAPPVSLSLGDTNASEMIPDVPQVEAQAVLCWSEYFNGKWQPARTSRVEEPVFVDRTAEGAFDRSDLSLWAREQGESLRLIILRPTSGASYFDVLNLHSLPQGGQLVNYAHVFPRLLDTSGSTLAVDLGNSSGGSALDLLKTNLADRTVQPQHTLAKPSMAPFFYGDDLHVFYVTPEQVFLPVDQSTSYGIGVTDVAKMMPELVIKEYGPPKPGPEPVVSNDLSATKRFLSEDVYIKKAIPMGKTVRFGQSNIGMKGTAPVSVIGGE